MTVERNAMTKIGIIGDGNVGSALTGGLTRAGFEVQAVGKEPGRVREVGAWAETLVLAVPFAERQNALKELGIVDGKVLVDVTNAIGEDNGLAVDPRRESGAEELQRLAPGARVVKAFNTVFAQNMDSGKVHGERLSAFVAADDAEAKRRVLDMARKIGFDGVDAGPLQNARWLETLGLLNVTLGYGAGLGTATGFRYVHEPAPPEEASRPPRRGATTSR